MRLFQRFPKLLALVFDAKNGVRLNRLSLKLTDVQVMIESAPIEQFLVRAPLDHLAVIERVMASSAATAPA